MTQHVNSKGEWWEYSGLAIYNKNGSKFFFDRILIHEGSRLNGVKLPPNNFFMEEFMKKLRAKDPQLMAMNYEISNATNFYSFDFIEEPWVTGNKTERFIYYTLGLTIDVVNGYSLEKEILPVQIKLKKIDDQFTFIRAVKINDGKVLGSIKYPTNAFIKDIPQYKDMDVKLDDILSDQPNYPAVPGDNGKLYPNDEFIINYVTEWATKKEENFALIFGDRAKSMFIHFEFQRDESAKLTNVENGFSKSFIVYYEFINEKIDKKEFKLYGGKRSINLTFDYIDSKLKLKFLEYQGETSYTKNDNIAWNYRNSYKAKTFENTIFRKK